MAAGIKSKLVEKLRSLYSTYVLGLVSIGYILGELGHYLIGTQFDSTSIKNRIFN